MKNKRLPIAAAPVFFLGLCLLLYPLVSDIVQSSLQARRVSTYTQTVGRGGSEEHARMLSEAEQFNAELSEELFSMELAEDQKARYESLLDPVGNGVMGIIEIPGIRVSLPVYHGISDGVLGAGAGHVPGSSLPVGGSGTHCLIAGHTGLSSSQLFTDLDQMKAGDEFTLTVLERRLCYRVRDVRVVTPEETRFLRPVDGEDLCTLITCTPYGINSHRLLVTGSRFFPEEGEETAQEGAPGPDPRQIGMAAVLAAMLALLLAAAALHRKEIFRGCWRASEKEIPGQEACRETEEKAD